MEVVENKPTSSLVGSLDKAVNGMPPPLCGRQVAQFSLQRGGWCQEVHSTVKTKMPGNADYYCGDPESGIKRPATPYTNGNKARKEREGFHTLE